MLHHKVQDQRNSIVSTSVFPVSELEFRQIDNLFLELYKSHIQSVCSNFFFIISDIVHDSGQAAEPIKAVTSWFRS